MLILSRRRNERILIGEGADQITVLLLEVRNGNTVKLGIDAPDSVKIMREELLGQPWRREERA